MDSTRTEARRLSKPRADRTAFGWAIAVVAALQYFTVVQAFFRFTADDAYIVARYAENFQAGAGLVFNLGERISALTSPLHALVLWPLTYVSADPLVPYKLIAVAGVFAAIAWSMLRLSKTSVSWVVLTALCLTSPFVILWTIGGLETPILLIAISLLTTLAFVGIETEKQLITVYGLAAVAFLTRYDSCLFTIPLVMYLALRWRRSAVSWAAIAACGITAFGWLIFSEVYFGDIFPTSFYMKSPLPNFYQFLRGCVLLVSFFICSGLVWPATCVARRFRQALKMLKEIDGEKSWLIVGTIFILAYGIFAGTKHMMFSYRLFVPYLLPIAIALLSTVRLSLAEEKILALAALLTNALLAWVILNYTLNPTLMHSALLLGKRPTGFEYPQENLRGYADGFLAGMRRNAEDTARHWKTLVAAEEGRRPRISTFAAGVLPFAFGDAYIFDSLGGYRHACSNRWWKKSSDYIHIIMPRQGSLKKQLGSLHEKLQLISREKIRFDGRDEALEVYYNPRPEANRQSNRVDRPCAGAASP